QPGDGKAAARWIRGEPREGGVAHQVRREDLDIHARSDEPFGQMIYVLFNPTDGRRKTLCQLDDSRRTGPLRIADLVDVRFVRSARATKGRQPEQPGGGVPRGVEEL